MEVWVALVVNRAVCCLFVFQSLGRGERAIETLPSVMIPCAVPWTFCFGLLSYLLLGKIWENTNGAVGKTEGQNKQKEKVRGALGRLFWWHLCPVGPVLSTETTPGLCLGDHFLVLEYDKSCGHGCLH